MGDVIARCMQAQTPEMPLTPWPMAAGRLGMVRMTGASPISVDRRPAE